MIRLGVDLGGSSAAYFAESRVMRQRVRAVYWAVLLLGWEYNIVVFAVSSDNETVAGRISAEKISLSQPAASRRDCERPAGPPRPRTFRVIHLVCGRRQGEELAGRRAGRAASRTTAGWRSRSWWRCKLEGMFARNAAKRRAVGTSA